MSGAHKSLVPKQRPLTDHESQTTFESWRESMLFHISLSDKSTRFLSTGDLKTWTTSDTPDRGFTDDGESGTGNITTENRMNKAAKAALLNVVLGSIATYAPVISSRFIKNQSTSLDSIWNRLRGYYGFRRTGSRILELMDLKYEQNESRESLWERLFSFIEDQLLSKDGEVLHEGATRTTNEVFTPTLINVLVTVWLHTINPALPAMVKQRFSTQLRSCTISSIREEISDAIPTLLSELEEKDCSINRAGTFQRNSFQRNRGTPNRSFKYSSKRSCCLCEAAGRPQTNHFLSGCPFLPPEDKKFMTKTREISAFSEDTTQFDEFDEEVSASASRQMQSSYPYNEPACLKKIDSTISQPCDIRRVDVFASPILEVSVGSKISSWTLDSGAEANVITMEECKRLGLEVLPTSQAATQGDGKTPLPTFG